MEVTVKLLENAMDSTLKEGRTKQGWTNGKGRFLIDGFPRKMDQALKFDEEVNILIPFEWKASLCCQVCLSSSVIFFTTTEEVMLKRLLERGETSGRDDDNIESIKKRFREFYLLLTIFWNKWFLRRHIQGSDYACD